MDHNNQLNEMDSKLEKEFSNIWDGLLHEKCCKKKDCGWDNMTKNNLEYNGYYLPYIGEHYVNQKDKILFLGINMNEYGGGENKKNALRELYIDQKIGAIHWIREGARKITFDKGEENKPQPQPDGKNWYGSPLYEYVACIATILTQKQSIDIAQLIEQLKTNSKEILHKKAEALKSIAFTNLVKCAPKNKRSQPLPQMINNCFDQILNYEIQNINPKPEFIIILGASYREIIKDIFQGENIENISEGIYLLRGKIKSLTYTIFILNWYKKWDRLKEFGKHIIDLDKISIS